MASSTPSAPITSSGGTADTTAGRIYFSTPSAQVLVPVGDLVFPTPTPPHTKLLAGKIIPPRKKYSAAESLSGGRIIIRVGAGGPKF